MAIDHFDRGHVPRGRYGGGGDPYYHDRKLKKLKVDFSHYSGGDPYD